TKSYMISVAFLGGVLYTLQASLYLSSVKYISASLAVLCSYSYPIFVAILSSIFEKEKVTNNLIAAIIIAVLGLALVLEKSIKVSNIRGILMALGTGVTYSIYIMVSNKTIKRASPIITAAFITLFTACSVLTIAISTHQLNINFAKSAWAPILGISFFSTVVSMVAFLRGLELIGSTRASILSMVEPIITFAFAAVLFHDRFSLTQWIGTALVLAGALLVITAKDKRLTQRGGYQELADHLDAAHR
ncbi:MAG: DMT family transporter, partial [Candidatus Saccharibacteria bacterium]